MKPDVIERKGYRGATEVVVVQREMPIAVAQLAISLVERFGMVACMPDGEDSAGRMKQRLQTPVEAAMRACETAQAMWSEFQMRDWLVALPAAKLADDEKP